MSLINPDVESYIKIYTNGFQSKAAAQLFLDGVKSAVERGLEDRFGDIARIIENLEKAITNWQEEETPDRNLE